MHTHNIDTAEKVNISKFFYSTEKYYVIVIFQIVSSYFYAELYLKSSFWMVMFSLVYIVLARARERQLLLPRPRHL